MLGVRLSCFSIVPTTVRESATSDPKINKPADAGSPLLSKAVGVRLVVAERVNVHGFLRGGVGRKYRATRVITSTFKGAYTGCSRMCASLRVGELAVP